jgi:hypothetical protein
MTDLESRVVALERAVLALSESIQYVALNQTLLGTFTGTTLRSIGEAVKTIRDELDGEGWRDFE